MSACTKRRVDHGYRWGSPSFHRCASATTGKAEEGPWLYGAPQQRLGSKPGEAAGRESPAADAANAAADATADATAVAGAAPFAGPDAIAAADDGAAAATSAVSPGDARAVIEQRR